MAQLRKAYIQAGGTWLDTRADRATVRQQVMARLAKGYPPTAMLWHGGVEADQILELGFLNGASALTPTRNWNRLYLPPVMRAIAHRGDFTGVPLNVHTESWLWLNRRVFAAAKLDVPTDWAGVLQAAKVLQSVGQTALLASTEPWQRRLLFNTVILGVAGEDAYGRLYTLLDESIARDPKFVEALTVFIELSHFAAQAEQDASWAAQTNGLAEGEGAMLVMGDWAKPVFLERGLRLREDIVCWLTPGNSERLLFQVDMLTFGASEETIDLENQRRLIEVAQDPKVLSRFSDIKGSVSPLQQTDAADLDACARQALDVLRETDGATRSLHSVGDSRINSAIDALIDQIWRTERPVAVVADDFAARLTSLAAER